VCACHLEPSCRLRCDVASHQRCPPASTIVGAAPVRFWSRPLGDEVLEQAAPLDKLQLPSACHGGHHLALPAHMHSPVDRVRWHFPSCHVARLGSDAPSTSPPPVAKGQCHARVASMRNHRSSRSLCHLCPRLHALLYMARLSASCQDRVVQSIPSTPVSATV
jgi:hypothetical protein